MKKWALVVCLLWMVSLGPAAGAAGQVGGNVMYFPRLEKPRQDVVMQHLEKTDYGRFYGYMSQITSEYSPRRPDFRKIYIDAACTLGSQPTLCGDVVCSNLASVETDLYTFFSGLGYAVHRENTDGYHGYNLVAVKTGSTTPDVILEVGAHVDADASLSGLSTPGASDNASGVAAVMEIATALREYVSHATIRFVIFVGEEEGLVGSKQHAKIAFTNHKLIKAALIMDAIAWSEDAPGYMNCIWANSDDNRSLTLGKNFDYARQRYQINIGWRFCGVAGEGASDHLPYWDYGYPSVLSIGGIPYNDPDYHACSDVMATADAQNAFYTMQENLAVLLLYDLNQEQDVDGQQLLAEYWASNPLARRFSDLEVGP